jgi:tetratricopeptide (TPR) repeat protein
MMDTSLKKTLLNRPVAKRRSRGMPPAGPVGIVCACLFLSTSALAVQDAPDLEPSLEDAAGPALIQDSTEDQAPAGEVNAGEAPAAEVIAVPVTTGESVTDSAVVEEGELTPAIPSDPVTSYLDAIDRMEAISSAYSTELADLYLSLGQSLLDSGDFEGAKKAFQVGMQIVRVNFGLNSVNQGQYLFPIADIESRLGDWKSANSILQNVYSINVRNFGEKHPDMLPVLSQLQDWYLRPIPDLPPHIGYANMLRATRMAFQMALIIEQDKGLGHPDTATINRRLGQLHYLMAQHLLNFGTTAGPEGGYKEGFGTPSRIVDAVSTKSHFEGGKEAFAKVVESMDNNAQVDPVVHAAAIAQLADWYLIFGKSQTAGRFYQRAFEVLDQTADPDRITEELFGQPTPLQFFNELNEVLEFEQDEDSGNNIEVSMTISRIGRIQDLEIVNPPEDMEKDELRKIERSFSDIRFRPRVIDGEPVKTEGFVWLYSLSKLDESAEIY